MSDEVEVEEAPPEASERPLAADLTGLDRAAAFLLILGEREATDILRHMEPTDIQRVAAAMSALRNISQEEAKGIIVDFCRMAGKESMLGGDAGAQAHIRKLLVNALGKDRAGDVISRVKMLDRRATGMEALARKEPREIADMVRSEHPQVTATLLAYLQPDQAGDVMGLLPRETQEDVLLRMANLEAVPLSAMEELNALVEAHMSSQGEFGVASSVGGPKAAASVLNALEGSMQSQILESIKSADEELGEIIENNMFTFDDLLRIDDRAIQSMLAEVSSQVLATALKGAENATKQKFFGNMSRRAAEMLEEDLEVGGPVKLSEVEAAQKEIVDTARRMIEAGTIVVGGVGGGEELVY